MVRRGLMVLSVALVAVATLYVAPVPRSDAVHSVAAVVVLSSNLKGTHLDGVGEDRLRAAVGLARRVAAPIITTRISVRGKTSDSAQAPMIGTLPWRIAPDTVRSTRDEVLAVRKIIPSGAAIAVVTSPLHTRRACDLFERAGYTVSCVAAPMRPELRTPWLTIKAVIRETAARAYYELRGWL
jgi:uncharacterized SAM-binding protein YcdF (DUF218 family)